MSMILFWFSMILMMIIAMSFFIYPFFAMQSGTFEKYSDTPQKKFLVLLLFISLFPIFSFFLYFHWGHSDLLKQFLDEKIKEQKVQEILSQYKTPEALIQRMKEILKQKPYSSEGWYLLGQLYMSNNQFDEAVSAFTQANSLKSNSIKIQIHLVSALFYQNHQKLNPQTLKLIQQILKQDPGNPILLNFIALDAYHRKDYSKAIQLWELLLKEIPPHSTTSQVLLTAIADAQKKQENLK